MGDFLDAKMIQIFKICNFTFSFLWCIVSFTEGRKYMTKKEKDDENKIVPITDDKMFFHIMHTNKKYLINLIHYITKIPIEKLKDLEYIDTTLGESNKKNKHERSDIVVKCDNYVINMEMNRSYYKELMVKNFSYLCLLNNNVNIEGEKYSIDEKFIQINFDCFNDYGKELKNKYILEEGIYKEKYPLQRMEIYHVLLDKLQNTKYTESEDVKLLDYLKIMVLQDEAEILAIGKKEEILKGVGEEIMRYSKKLPLGYRDTDLEQKILLNTYKIEGRNEGLKEGLQEGEARGIEKGKEQTAKNMLELNVDINTISKATGLSINTIMKL